MITEEEVLGIGFIKLVSDDTEGRDVYFKTTNGLGWNVGIDFLNKECFYFEGKRSTAFPYPIPAKIITRFHYPECIDDLKNIFYSLTGNKL